LLSPHSRQSSNRFIEPVRIALFQRRGEGRFWLSLRLNEKKNKNA